MNPNSFSDPTICLNPLTAFSKFDVYEDEIEDDYMETLNENFTDCLLKRGCLYRSTGLRNVKRRTDSLKYFSDIFSEEINRENAENTNRVLYDVEMKMIDSGIQGSHSLKVCVYRSVDDDDEKQEVVYVGVFFSWRVVNSQLSQEYLNLPFLFSCGTKKFIQALNSLFVKYFDTKISPLIFGQTDFKWLLAALCEYVNGESDDYIQFIYQHGKKDLKVEFKFSFVDLKDIWNKIHNGGGSEIKHEEVITLSAAINEHVCESFSLSLDSLRLKNFSLSRHITLDSSGKVRIYKRKLLDLFFRLLIASHQIQ